MCGVHRLSLRARLSNSHGRLMESATLGFSTALECLRQALQSCDPLIRRLRYCSIAPPPLLAGFAHPAGRWGSASPAAAPALSPSNAWKLLSRGVSPQAGGKSFYLENRKPLNHPKLKKHFRNSVPAQFLNLKLLTLSHKLQNPNVQDFGVSCFGFLDRLLGRFIFRHWLGRRGGLFYAFFLEALKGQPRLHVPEQYMFGP